MAFDQVMLRTSGGQEYGPVAMDELQHWHREGRVPRDATLVDTATGETRPVSSFPLLALTPPPPSGMSYTAQAAPSAMDHLIPAKNPKALIAYYCGVFSIAIWPGGIAALILGVLGLKEAKALGVGRTHAIVGIVLGTLTTLIMLGIVTLIIIGIASSDS